MKEEKQNSEFKDDSIKSLKVRLDALILIMLSTHFKDEKGKINLSDSAKLLRTAGLTPTEIALLLGKKNRTDIAQYLYAKKK